MLDGRTLVGVCCLQRGIGLRVPDPDKSISIRRRCRTGVPNEGAFLSLGRRWWRVKTHSTVARLRAHRCSRWQWASGARRPGFWARRRSERAVPSCGSAACAQSDEGRTEQDVESWGNLWFGFGQRVAHYYVVSVEAVACGHSSRGKQVAMVEWVAVWRSLVEAPSQGSRTAAGFVMCVLRGLPREAYGCFLFSR